jgi:hypothetical protein
MRQKPGVRGGAPGPARARREPRRGTVRVARGERPPRARKTWHASSPARRPSFAGLLASPTERECIQHARVPRLRAGGARFAAGHHGGGEARVQQRARARTVRARARPRAPHCPPAPARHAVATCRATDSAAARAAALPRRPPIRARSRQQCATSISRAASRPSPRARRSLCPAPPALPPRPPRSLPRCAPPAPSARSGSTSGRSPTRAPSPSTRWRSSTTSPTRWSPAA